MIFLGAWRLVLRSKHYFCQMFEDLSPDLFDYDLPAERIPAFPLKERQHARLLISHGGVIQDALFKDVPKILGEQTQLILNDTKVIHARLFLQKPTGGRVELFLLQPFEATIEEAMLHQGATKWWCLIGGAKKWKEGKVSIEAEGIQLQAEKLDRDQERFCVQIEWNDEAKPLALVLEELGKIPLPPYMQREAEEEDAIRYQTTYASRPGSVAAPTAGLHFTPEILSESKAELVKLTLHVSAGTFKPVSSDKLSEHTMHDEECHVKKQALIQLSKPMKRFAVGTTSLRTLESLYWVAVRLKESGELPQEIIQTDPYTFEDSFADFEEAMNSLVKYLELNELNSIEFRTSIMISPGYKVKSIVGLFTNFHMPKSTLLFLVAALIGDRWQDVYAHALNHDYRFLSYGDSSLLIP
ncbi:MAG: S-adenosylmethionine:tRNA ribosyltransferase-isomerase [Flavobacteriales bacterium]